MRNFSLENEKYKDILKSQMIHMDQGISYNPEYLSTRKMSYYPSRIAQIIWSVYNGHIPPSSYGSEIVFSPILSGLGERWQNFGENQNDYFLSLILGRELFVKAGFENINESEVGFSENDTQVDNIWQNAFECEKNSKKILFVDKASYYYCKNSAKNLSNFLTKKDIKICEYGYYDNYLEYFANGFIDIGIEKLSNIIKTFEDKKIEEIITVSGANHFVLTVLCPILGIEYNFKVTNVLELASSLNVKESFIYAGSFYSRFLKMSDVINNLSENTKENKAGNSHEFIPNVQGDKRVNVVTIWGRPLVPEFFVKENLLTDKIYNLATDEINRFSFKQIVICEPFAYNKINKTNFNADKSIYFWDAL